MSLCLWCMLLLHPYHVTDAEAQWNGQTERLEVSLKMELSDIDRLLSDHLGSRYRVAKIDDQQLSKDLTDCLATRFVLQASDDHRGALEWVGLERSDRSVVAYFQLSLPEATAEHPRSSVRLLNRILIGVQSRQTNVVTFLLDEKVSLEFREEAEVQPLPEGVLPRSS
jgi:hypothetical protein